MKYESKKTVKVIPGFYFGMIKQDGFQEEIWVNLGSEYLGREVLACGLDFSLMEVYSIEANDSAVSDLDI